MTHKCRFCPPTKDYDFNSLRSLRAHVAQIHDGGERFGPLRCTILGCQSQYLSRTRFVEHVASHGDVNGNVVKVGGSGAASDNNVDQGAEEDSEDVNWYTCSTCQKVYTSIDRFDSHLDGHSQVVLEESVQDSLENEDQTALSDIKSQLTDVAKNAEVVDVVLTWVVPSVCVHESGERSMAMLTRSSAKRQLDDPIIDVQPIKYHAKGVESDPKELKDALAGYRFGGLVETDLYEPIEPPLYLADFSKRKEEIARAFAGALLQSRFSVVLILKAEVYGRSPIEDIHGIELAKPKWEMKTIAVMLHDNTRKLLIGTHSYNILVTAAMDLEMGTVSVGASTPLHISSNTRLWCRKDRELNPLVERQLRSKFDDAITFANCAAVFYQFASWECQPVTIFKLLNYYKRKGSSGTKAVATLFSEIAKTQSITRTLLQSLRTELDAKDHSVAKTLRTMLEIFKADEQERPLLNDQKMSRLLRSLADGVCGAIRSLNDDKVVAAIKARSEVLLQDKPSH
ncbi:hypothetical protein BG011_004068 [Mortierella polycephala]|uniref:C2H2-type domain-containing protein n=1 Tax=Mortierella polycephala TaxID=41804 RepID=A0A9P6U2W6_9FUNG|nr:hypothetical protein BG011_004068 [Mortierella polycephala]